MARGGKGTSYPEDFKRSAIELVLTEEQSIRETEKILECMKKHHTNGSVDIKKRMILKKSQKRVEILKESSNV